MRIDLVGMSIQKIFKLIGLVAFAVFMIQGCLPAESIADKMQRLVSKYDIEIKAGDPAYFFPQDYTKKDAGLAGIELFPTTLSQASEAVEGIEKALEAYPDEFVSKYIDAIYIAGKIKIEGAEAGGTYGPAWIIISNIPAWNGSGANKDNAFYAVHHELSSFIFSRHPETRIMWHSMMPIAWKPASSDYEALTTDSSKPASYNRGFLSRYAETSVGNDFNVYAEHIFGDPDKLRGLASEYEIIAQKVGVFINVYVSEEPKLRGYFKSAGLMDVAKNVKQIDMSFKIDVSNIKPTKIEGL